MTIKTAIVDHLSKDFPEATIGTRWQMVADAIMGGVSSGRMTRVVLSGRRAIQMQGTVSLENNGGFIQNSLDLAPGGRTKDGAGFTGIAIDVLGNGEEYGLHLRTPDLTRPWQSFRQSFIAEPVWREIQLPFAGFFPHRTDVPLNTGHLRRLGIVAIGRAFHADLSIGGVRFLATSNSIASLSASGLWKIVFVVSIFQSRNRNIM